MKELFKLKAKIFESIKKDMRNQKINITREESKLIIKAIGIYAKMKYCLLRYELFEANMVLEDECWEESNPKLTDDLYQDLLDIQGLRNEALEDDEQTT